MRSIDSKTVALACLIVATVCRPSQAEAEQPSNSPVQAQPAPPSSRSEMESPGERQHAADSVPGGSGHPQAPRSAKSKGRDHFEVGVMPRYISNYFESQDEFTSAAAITPKKPVYITTVSASYDHDFIQHKGSTLTGEVRFRRNFYSNLEGADSTDIDVSLNYIFQPNQLRIAYFGTPRRLVSNNGGHHVYGRSTGFDAEYSRQITSRLRARGGYQFARQTFSEFQERNLSQHLLYGSLRYRVNPLFMPGIGFQYLHANGTMENFSYKRPALVLTVTSRLRDVAYFSFRYRGSDRSYDTDVSTDSNFRREDHRHDFSFYGTVQLGRGFSLFGYGDHTTNNSNRQASTYKNNEIGLGLFYRFPG